jgi:hypothetical protein
MAHIKRVDEMAGANMSASDTKRRGIKLAKRAKTYYAGGDMKNAGRVWEEICDLYKGVTGIDAMRDMHAIMTMFTEDEVCGITNYLMSKQSY